MICTSCGTDNAAGRPFCDECGAPLASACPNCGESNRPTAKFCGNCSAALTGSPSHAAPGNAPAPRRDVAEPAAAERRFVSVLFVDLVGFTPFAEERDAEQVRETLDRYFGLARLAVDRHGGTIEKFIGDAVMAVWGTPTAHEDDAERAVRAGLELVDAVHGLGPGIAARAGIVSGEAAVSIGAEGQGMVAGDLVNTASRLQSVAPAGAVLVAETTMNAAKAAIAFESVGEQELKGKSAPVAAYRALRVVANRGGQNRSETLEAPFAGRDEELRMLKELLHATARDERVRLVSISGPAGIGKSRLTWELEKYVDGVVETIYWHRGRSPAYGEGITFWALGEMIRRRAELAESDDDATTRARIATTVADFVPEAEERQWVETALLALLGLEPSPAGGRDALFAAWRIFFERIAERGPTVLVFEDLQWADSGLLDFIEHLLEWSKNRPILVVALTRPELYERRPGWGSGHRLVTAMPLEPLPEAAMRELLAGLAPGLPEAAVQTILGRADGIPLYAVETIRMLVSDGRLEAVEGTYRPVGELHDLAVPETLRSLIASRLDGLDAVDRSLLQDGAVLGQRFTLAALTAISGIPPDEIEGRLRNLVRREMLDLELDPRSPERGQYGFVQSLIREVGYGTLARRERRTRHLAAARYFEALGDDELAGLLATHYLAAHAASAGGPEADAVAIQARIALRGAGERAAALGAHEQALNYLEQALALRADTAERTMLLELAAESANASGHAEAADRYAREAIDIHRAASDEQAAARTSALLGRILIDQGRMADAIESMEAAISRAGAGVADPEVAALLATLSRAHMRSDENMRSIETADRALAIAEVRNLEQVTAEAFINKASSLHRLGRTREATALHETAIKLADAGGWLDLQLRGRNNLSVNQIEEDPRRAFATVLEGLELARKVGRRGMFNWLAGTAGMYAVYMGDDWDRPLGLIDETLASSPPPYDLARATEIRNLLRAYRGENLDELVAEAEAVSAGIADGQIVGAIDNLRGVIALVQGRLTDAYAAALRAVDAWPDSAPLLLETAMRAALYAGKGDDARTIAQRLDEYPSGSASVNAARQWAAACVGALDDQPAQALELYRSAIGAYRGMGLDFRAANAILDAVKLLPTENEVRGWAPDARAVFERVRAKPYVEMLDEALATPPAAPPARVRTAKAQSPA